MNTVTDFKIIDKTIRKYISSSLKTSKQLNEYVSNSHIAETFKGVLIYSELESKNQELFDNIKHPPYDSIGGNNPDDYDILPDGRFLKKETYSVGINPLLVPAYFDLDRLKKEGDSELVSVYQKLREKKDIIRNNILLGHIVLRDLTHPQLATAYKIKISKTDN